MPTGTATLNFGVASAKTLDISQVVTGQAAIVSGSKVEAYLMGDTTADHEADEHIMAVSMMDLVCGAIVAGTGFTIYANVRDDISKAGLTGQFTVQWVWS